MISRNTMPKRSTSPRKDGTGTEKRIAAGFVSALPQDGWAIAQNNSATRAAVMLGLVEREKVGVGTYRFRRVAR